MKWFTRTSDEINKIHRMRLALSGRDCQLYTTSYSVFYISRTQIESLQQIFQVSSSNNNPDTRLKF